ncbi:MAG: hypothetical protein IT203_05225 [Fimbriimonadaceae bacterium]|nr:hypothetical protein [Fimbriimonadaceae bacterium]
MSGYPSSDKDRLGCNIHWSETAKGRRFATPSLPLKTVRNARPVHVLRFRLSMEQLLPWIALAFFLGLVAGYSWSRASSAHRLEVYGR